MTKVELVRRMVARAQIKGTDQEKLVKRVMVRCEFTRGLAVTYIRKIKGTAALRNTVKELREKMADAPAKSKAVKVEGKRRGRPRKTEVTAPVVAETAPQTPPANRWPWPTSSMVYQEPAEAAS